MLHWYETLVWLPNLVAFVVMLAVSGQHLREVPLYAPMPTSAADIMSFGATIAANLVSYSTLTPDYGVYHDHTASA